MEDGSNGHLGDATVSKTMGVTNPIPSNVVNQKESTTSIAIPPLGLVAGLELPSKLGTILIVKTSEEEQRKFMQCNTKALKTFTIDLKMRIIQLPFAHLVIQVKKA